ncbi:hybrid sensor histidine kinase/response regulator [Pelagibius sp. Alg239-R121]|uniref:hybrid sensor histidine kinase/response regulator n=1 Tax=Pelagibius sp. Alg239-R121 TaxID=2993448 RepID=UPI0024A6E12E|nr:hybrid sensor histidine kinase/response regulator [Pelagibius sp. Alg239-R121]
MTVDDGLSHSDVTSVLQDPLGFIWVGTRAGLNRYDGSQIKTFLNDPENSNSIGHNWAWNLMVDKDGMLWSISWGGGLTRIDLERENYSHFKHDDRDPHSLSSDNCWTLFQDSTGTFWVGTEEGLDRLDKDGKTFSHFRHDPDKEDSLAGNSVSSIQEDAQGRLWIASYGGGVSVLDRERKSFKRYVHAADDPSSLSDNNIWSMVIDRSGDVWVGTEKGLNRYISDQEGFRRYQHEPGNSSSLGANRVLNVFEDSKERLWVGTWEGGLSVMDQESETFQTVPYNPIDPASPANVIRIMEDRDGTIWMGAQNGLFKYDAGEHRFSKYEHQPYNPNGLSAPVIDSFHMDQAGNLWIAPLNGGLDRLDPTRRHYTHFRHDPQDKQSLLSDQVRTILGDGEGGLWLATDTGLDHFDPETGQFQPLSSDLPGSEGLSSGNILDMSVDPEGAIWAAIYGTSVDRFEPKSGRVTRFRVADNDPTKGLATVWNRVVEAASDGTTWTGGEGGLSRIDPQTGEVWNVDPVKNGLSDLNVYSIHEDHSGTIWVGTLDGLSRFEAETRSFKTYRDTKGEVGSQVMDILDDAEGNIWISTNNGISRLDPTSGEFRTFNVFDNLQGKVFRYRAGYASPQGEFYFGGLSGFNSFFPAKVVDNPNPPQVVFTDFQVNNKDVSVSASGPLEKSVPYAQTVTLRRDQNSFALGFSAISMRTPENTRYAHILEGFDSDWRLAGDSRKVTYTNLDPGSYTMRVKAANNDGLWNEESRVLNVIVLPAWWESRPAYAAYAVAAVLLIMTIVHLRTVAYRRQAVRLEADIEERTSSLAKEIEEKTQIEGVLRHTNELLEKANSNLSAAKNKAEEANQSKSRFLANISHEIRTPLNTILGFSEIMRRDQDLDTHQLNNLTTICRSGEHLLTLINNVLEMSTIEVGKVVMRPSPFDLHLLLQDLQTMFGPRAREKNLSLEVSIDETVSRHITTDEGKLRQILINLLINAFKFTSKGGVFVTVSALPYQNEGIKLLFEVADTGVGIPVNELHKVFQPFEQAGQGVSEQAGTGLGMSISREYARVMGGDLSVSSEVGEGSTFRLEIQVAASSPAVITVESPRRLVSRLADDQPSFKILIVDDMETNREFLAQLLVPLGFSAEKAANGIEAIEAFENWSPDLILMDLRMPEMDGFQAIERIRSLPGRTKVPIIAVTAHAFEEERQETLRRGADDVLCKPLNAQLLLEALQRHLGAEYTYDEAPKTAKLAESVTARIEEYRQASRSLPKGVAENMRIAVEKLDIKGMEALIGSLPSEDEDFAEVLRQLVDDFEWEILADLLYLQDDGNGRLPV